MIKDDDDNDDDDLIDRETIQILKKEFNEYIIFL